MQAEHRAGSPEVLGSLVGQQDGGASRTEEAIGHQHGSVIPKVPTATKQVLKPRHKHRALKKAYNICQLCHTRDGNAIMQKQREAVTTRAVV